MSSWTCDCAEWRCRLRRWWRGGSRHSTVYDHAGRAYRHGRRPYDSQEAK